MTNKEGKKVRVIKPGYLFVPADPNVLLGGHAMAGAYKISFNKLLSFLLEDAIAKWSVPSMVRRPKVGSVT